MLYTRETVEAQLEAAKNSPLFIRGDFLRGLHDPFFGSSPQLSLVQIIQYGGSEVKPFQRIIFLYAKTNASRALWLSFTFNITRENSVLQRESPVRKTLS